MDCYSLDDGVAQISPPVGGRWRAAPEGLSSLIMPPLKGEVSAQLTEEDFTEDTLVLVMEHAQLEKVLEKYERANPENVYVLTELVGDELEILDPYGGSLQAYGLCYETMRKTIKKLVTLLNEESNEGSGEN